MSKRQEKLSPEAWQARHDAACAIVARKYCDLFGFWRDCRYRLCRSARRCSGDQGFCLGSRWQSVPYDDGLAARNRIAAERPRNADRFTRAAHHYAHHCLCLHKATSAKMRDKLHNFHLSLAGRGRANEVSEGEGDRA